MTTVYWDYCNEKNKDWFSLALIEPSPALPEIIKARDVTHQSHFAHCPAFKSYYKNTYVIKSPIDIEISYDETTKNLNIFPQMQKFFDDNITHRGATIGDTDPFLMSIGFNYLFIADEDCFMELIPASMHDSEFTASTRIINGVFNINKWYRPIEIAFEFKDNTKKLKIKRGEPLAYVRFTTKKEEKIKLQHKMFPEKTLEAVNACAYVKSLENRFSLETLYALSERVRSKLWFNKKKCPFNWRKK
jgi:hypothetical protein